MIFTQFDAAKRRDGQKLYKRLSAAGHGASVFGFGQMLIAAGYSDTNTVPDNEIVVRLAAGLAIFLLGCLLVSVKRIQRRAGE